MYSIYVIVKLPYIQYIFVCKCIYFIIELVFFDAPRAVQYISHKSLEYYMAQKNSKKPANFEHKILKHKKIV